MYITGMSEIDFWSILLNGMGFLRNLVTVQFHPVLLKNVVCVKMNYISGTEQQSMVMNYMSHSLSLNRVCTAFYMYK